MTESSSHRDFVVSADGHVLEPALACRYLTGLSTIIWGDDHPHAEGTFRGSRQLIEQQFARVPDDERKAILGGTLADVLGLSRVPA